MIGAQTYQVRCYDSLKGIWKVVVVFDILENVVIIDLKIV